MATVAMVATAMTDTTAEMAEMVTMIGEAIMITMTAENSTHAACTPKFGDLIPATAHDAE